MRYDGLVSGRPLVLCAVLVACTAGDADPDPAPIAPGSSAVSWRDDPVLGRVLWDAARDRPRLIIGRLAGTGADAAAIARDALARHAEQLGLDGTDLAVAAVRTGRAGSYVRFAQHVGGLPVLGAEVIALVAAGEVRAVQLAHVPGLAPPVGGGDIGPAAALAAVRARTGGGSERGAPRVVRGIAVEPGGARVSYRVTVLAAAGPTWGADVDAVTGAVTRLRDLRMRVDGTGLVFDPNAVDATGNTALVDGNDATTAALDAARVSVTIRHLDASGFLRGTWADVRPPASTPRADENTHVYNYNRTDDRFEEVMAYYHLDRSQQRIQDLGYTDVNNRVQVAIVNALAEDNSYYDPATKQIAYGYGGVDDAEDADIVLHEYGHSIQDDLVPGWGIGGDTGAMGEGFGDYLGAGFVGTLATQAGHPGMIATACVGEWDATSYDTGDPPCLRRTDGDKHFPEDAVGQVHADGEMWSAALMRIRADVGADIGDTLALEHHFMLNDSADFGTAAAALVAADENVYAGAHRTALRRALFARGLLRTPLPAGTAPDVLASLAVSVDPPRVGGQYDDDLDDTQSVTFPGAAAVRVHFTQIATEAGSGTSCIDGGCDNLYLSNADGDLYQIAFGAASDVVSVVVPGDTIALRLVSDGSVHATGYHVDRIDSMGDDGVDAGPTPDAAAPTIDAAPAGSPDAGRAYDYGGGGGCCDGTGGASLGPALIVLALVLRRRRQW